MNSIIFFFTNWQGWTSVPHGLHFNVCDLYPFWNLCILFRMWSFRSTSTVSSRSTHFKNPKMRSHWVNNSQAILEKSKGSHLTMCLILNLSLSSVTDAGRFILFPFKVTLTSFQSISITYHNIFLFNLTCSGINFPVI